MAHMYKKVSLKSKVHFGIRLEEIGLKTGHILSNGRHSNIGINATFCSLTFLFHCKEDTIYLLTLSNIL